MPRRQPKITSYYKKKYTPKLHKIIDKKINTVYERRAQEIAKREIAKAHPSLISRNICFQRYDPETNRFGNLADAALKWIGWAGRVVELSNVPQVDIEFNANNPQADDPNTAADESQDAGGVGHGAPTQPNNSNRISDEIMITGFGIELDIKTQREDTYAPNAEQNESPIEIRYGVYLFKDTDVNMDNAGSALPSTNTLIKWRPFGYNSQLDSNDVLDSDTYKIRKIVEYKTKISTKSHIYSCKRTKKSIRLKTPIRIKYKPNDQNGQRPINWKVLFAIMSNVPEIREDHQPIVCACTKMYYTNKL